MRVTIATRIFAPEPAAAAYRLAALAEALSDGSDDVTVLTSASRGPGAYRRDGVRVRRAPVLRDASGQIRGYLQYLSFDLPLFFRLLFGRRSDVIVTEPPPTTGLVVRLAAAVRRTPYVYFAADIWSDAAASTGASPVVVRAVRWMERRALNAAAHVIAVTEGVADRVRELADHQRVTVVRNGIDTSVFTPDGSTLDGPPRAVYAGTTSEWQGADVFVRALPLVLEKVPDARLVFVGQGSAWGQLKALAAVVAPDSTEFHDLVPPAEAARWLRSAHVGLVSMKPGQGYDFAFPTKIFASLACGTPVLYAGPGEAVAAIHDDALGEVVEYDPEQVAISMVRLLRSARSDARRLSDWVEAHASIAQSARRAASIVRASR